MGWAGVLVFLALVLLLLCCLWVPMDAGVLGNCASSGTQGSALHEGPRRYPLNAICLWRTQDGRRQLPYLCFDEPYQAA